MDGRKTKKMVTIEKEIASFQQTIGDINNKVGYLTAFEATTGPGKKAQEEALTQMKNEISTFQRDIEDRKVKLEVATVEMLAGADKNFEEPTPQEALKQAS